jgi:hypothetical protein
MRFTAGDGRARPKLYGMSAKRVGAALASKAAHDPAAGSATKIGKIALRIESMANISI